MNEIEISVIVPTYFHEKYVGEALDTILCQEIDCAYEIVIADDASQDGTVGIVNKYKEKYPDIIQIHVNERNLGICRNMYEAYLRCRGKYIVLSAGDDYWIDNRKLQKQYDFLEKNEDFVAECTVIECRYSDGQITKNPHSPQEKYRGLEFRREDFLNGNIYPTSGMMFRNVFVQHAAKEQFGLIPRFCRDIDDLVFSMFIFDYGKVHISNEITYVVRARREEEKDKNFNSKYRGVTNYIEHLKLLNKLDEYYNKKYELKKWYESMFQSLIYNIYTGRQWSAVRYVKLVPAKYWLEFGWNYLKEIVNAIVKK